MKPTLADIIRKAAKMSGYSVDQIKGECRHRPMCRVRFAVYKIAYSRGYSYVRIGRELKRDHTTVISGAKVCEEYTKREPKYAAFVSGLHIFAHREITAPVMVAFNFAAPLPVAAAPAPMPKPYRPKPRNVFDNSDKLFAQEGDLAIEYAKGSFQLAKALVA